MGNILKDITGHLNLMKLLIIGGTGFIGKNLKNYFEGEKYFEVYS